MQYSYHNMVRKYVIAFSNLFSNVIVVHPTDNEENEPKEIKVPIVYATKSKMYYEIREKTTERSKAIVNTYVPRLGFFISGMQYDPTRKLNNTINIKLNTEDYLRYPGVPYNLTFELSALTKKQDDLFQIIEQVAVLFNPDKTITIKEITDVDRDVSINLDNVSLSSLYEYTEDENRVISADFTFTLKGYLYPRINNDTLDGDEEGIIKTIINNYRNELGVLGSAVTQTQETPQSEIIKTIVNYW